MKVGVLGDVHGNIDALRAVFVEIESEGIDQLLVTGDLVGYYYHADKVLDAIKEWDHVIVQGNHESKLSCFPSWGAETKEAYRKKYGSALELECSGLLSRNQIDYLSGLSHPQEVSLCSKKILLCHGSPWDRDEYVYPDAQQQVLSKCAEGGHDVVIMGHTHHQMLVSVGSTVLLNPGSVGQPRGGGVQACWAVLDLDGSGASLRSTPYDTSSLRKEIARRDPDVPYLTKALGRSVR